MNTYENEIIKPMLTEPGVKYFLNETRFMTWVFLEFFFYRSNFTQTKHKNKKKK